MYNRLLYIVVSNASCYEADMLEGEISNMNSVGSEVLTAVVMKYSVFWDITPCSRLEVNCWLSTDYTALYPRRQNSSYECCLLLSELQSTLISSLIPLKYYGRVIFSQSKWVRPPHSNIYNRIRYTLCFLTTTAMEKIEGARSSETSVNFNHTIRCHGIPPQKTEIFTDIRYLLRNISAYTYTVAIAASKLQGTDVPLTIRY
jgi:hypothetical protein